MASKKYVGKNVAIKNPKKEMADIIFNHFKKGETNYDEEHHCRLLVDVMMDFNRGTYSAYCVAAMIAEATFNRWVRDHRLFGDLYYFCKMIMREQWEKSGRELRDTTYIKGEMSFAYEHWKLMGWVRFGISKNSKIRINVKPGDSALDHYTAIMRQATEGDFTAAEFKQLMEAVNVGLNVHQTFELQNQINALKSDLITMKDNAIADNSSAIKGIEKKD